MAFFFLATGDLTVEEIEKKKKRAKRNRERRVVERERVRCKFFGLRNKYRMY